MTFNSKTSASIWLAPNKTATNLCNELFTQHAIAATCNNLITEMYRILV